MKPILVYVGEGTGAPTREGIQSFLTARGLPWDPLPPEAVTATRLASASALYVPGGWAWPYVQMIAPEGKRAIRDFVRGGGSYIGVCAGSYFAADVIRWQDRIVEYDLDLFAGTASGPIDAIQPWKSWRMTYLDLDARHPINAGETEQQALYWGGPAYRPHAGHDVTVLARYRATGEAAAITSAFGLGQVLLMGCHLEIGWDETRKAFDLEGAHGARWDWLERAVRWAILQTEENRERV